MFQDIDDGIQKFLNHNGDVNHALQVINKLIEENRGTMIEYALTYAKGKLQAI
jgi:hypothetical protein